MISAAASKSDSGGLLARLRRATRAEHAAAERELRLADESLTRADYARYVERFYGFYHPLEERIFRVEGLRAYLDPEPRRKTGALRQDLRAMGVSDPERLPCCDYIPEVRTLAAAIGCLYVMEGATLGGQLISRHVERLLQIRRESGGRFFGGYGPSNGVMWREFCRVLERLPLSEGEMREAERAAIATFRGLRRWCGPTEAQ